MAEDKKLNPEELEKVAGGDGIVFYDPNGRPIGRLVCKKCGADLISENGVYVCPNGCK